MEVLLLILERDVNSLKGYSTFFKIFRFPFNILPEKRHCEVVSCPRTSIDTAGAQAQTSTSEFKNPARRLLVLSFPHLTEEPYLFV